MEHLKNPRIFLIIVIIATIVAGSIAWQTRYRAHPDEISHGNGFCYYETHHWPPDLNSDDVFYDPWGWNRAYSGEIVYIIYGWLGGLVRNTVEPIVRRLKPNEFSSPGCQPVIEIYRLFNIVLFLFVLLTIWRVAQRQPWLIGLAVLMLLIPQVVYIYSYANDDAWGLSMSIFLFLYVVGKKETSVFSRRGMIGLGVLTGLVILSKQNFWLSLPFCYLLLVSRAWTSDWRKKLDGHEFLAQAIFLCATTLVVIAPLTIIYPISQGNFADKAEQQLNQRARDDLKPSQTTSPGYRLQSHGAPFEQILGDRVWAIYSIESFYGLFGGYTVILPNSIYFPAAFGFFLLAIIAAAAILKAWAKTSLLSRTVYLLSFFLILAAVLASMVYSWTSDYQPQGRYLFPALVALAAVLHGTVEINSRALAALRTTIEFLLFGLSQYVLWTFVAQNPLLR